MTNLNILIAAAEYAPLAKTGGLADVVGALPGALRQLNCEARPIIPCHRVIKEKYGSQIQHICSFSVNLGWRSQYVGLEKLILDQMTVYLIDNEYYFGDRIYRGGTAEGEQYAYFSRAVAESIPLLDFTPHILHVNDWHTAMLPLLLKTQYQTRKQGSLKTLLTIHNIAYQGKFSFEFVTDLLGVDQRFLTSEYMESFGSADFLKAGCVFADRINTVSPTYAQEIKTACSGEGLEGVLCARSSELSGILNGIDYAMFNPENDPVITAPFSAEQMSGKELCKEAAFDELGLTLAVPGTPLIATVARLVEQKGFDLIDRVLNELMQENIAMVIMGTGEARLEDIFRRAEARYKGRLCAYLAYNDAVAHRIYSAADFFLMPSRFEPCGLAQMIAMRYGALPIVHETGGLKDSVQPYNQYTGDGNGFSFANYNAHEMLDTVRRALSVYHDPIRFSQLRYAAMNADFSFARPAREYAQLYRQLLT